MEQNLKQFYKFINKLRDTDKNKINEISILAETFKENEKICKHITEIVMDRILIVENDLKLCFFYVMDSIIKNIGEPFNRYFSENLVPTFVDSFKTCKDISIRQKLYKLRSTWKDKQFPYEILYNLDMQIKAIDPNWPLVSKKSIDSDSNNNKRKSEISPSDKIEEIPPKIIKLERIDDNIKSEQKDDVMNHKWNSDDILNKLTNIPDLKSILVTVNNLNSVNEKVENKIDNSKPPPSMIYEEYSTSVPITAFPISCNPAPTLSNPPIIQPFNSGLPLPIDPIPNYPIGRNERRFYPYCWSNQINGFPQMPKIGTDPRLLYKCPYRDINKPVLIENINHLVLLDRIQPCVFIEGSLHAVRFVCSYINVVIDGINFELSTNEVNFVIIKNKQVTLCIGGPFHEIIIDGWPYHVPMTGQVCQIKLGEVPVEISFNVKKAFRLKIMQPIPQFLCSWVEAEFFGHPKSMSIPPMNPLTNTRLQDPLSMRFRMEIQNNFVNNPIVSCVQPNVVYPVYSAPVIANPIKIETSVPFQPQGLVIAPMKNVTPPPTIVQKSVTPSLINSNTNINTNVSRSSSSIVDVNKVFNQLVSSGIISEQILKTEDLNLTKYQYDTFKKFNPEVVTQLHSDYQCDICGIRFPDKNSKSFETHLDYHYLKNSINLQSKLKSRNFSKGSKVWVLGNQNVQMKELEDACQANSKKSTNRCPRFDDWELNKCSVCNDRFEEEYDEEEETEMLLDAVLSNGKAYHSICIDDVGKSFKTENVSEENQNKNDNTDDDPFLLLFKILNGKSLLPNLSNAV